MKKTILLLVITLTVVINTAKAAEDTNSTDMEKRIKQLQKKGMKRRSTDIERKRRNNELSELQGLSREERREKMKQLRAKRIKDMEAARAERANNKGVTHPKEAMGQTKSLENIKTQLDKEDKKHLNRLAKLNRIKVLATEGNNTKILDRVNKLIVKEQRRYAGKRQRIQNRQRMLERLKAREKEIKGPDKQRLTKEAIEKARKEQYLESKNNPRPIKNK